jgi:archaemetzincin
MMNFVKKSDVDIVLGVTILDLYVPGLNFVFGEAHCPGKVAVISLFRLNPEFYGQPADMQLFYERAVKEAVHEVGHTLGLAHCRNSSCVMFFSNSILDTDRKKSSLCEKCSASVAELVGERAF